MFICLFVIIHIYHNIIIINEDGKIYIYIYVWYNKSFYIIYKNIVE